MFRIVPLSIIRSFSLYTQQCHTGLLTELPDPTHKLYDVYHCCVYSENLLLMDIGTVRNM